jgi:hypothetical protein
MDQKFLAVVETEPEPEPEPEPGWRSQMNDFDHEKMDVYVAVVAMLVQMVKRLGDPGTGTGTGTGTKGSP